MLHSNHTLHYLRSRVAACRGIAAELEAGSARHEFEHDAQFMEDMLLVLEAENELAIRDMAASMERCESLHRLEVVRVGEEGLVDAMVHLDGEVCPVWRAKVAKL